LGLQLPQYLLYWVTIVSTSPISHHHPMLSVLFKDRQGAGPWVHSGPLSTWVTDTFYYFFAPNAGGAVRLDALARRGVVIGAAGWRCFAS
jgi:hypothetical protein